MSNFAFLLRAALGENNSSTFNKFGYVAGLVAVAQTVWSEGGLYAYPAAAITMSVASTDANDDFGGSGAQQVEVMGLDADFNEVTETINLDGQTEVALPTDLIRVNRAKVLGAIDAVGDIYIGTGTFTTGVPANVYGKIDIGENQTLQAVFTVPRGKKALVFTFSASSAKNEEITVSLKARPFGGVLQTKDKHDIYQNAITQPYMPPLVFDEKTDIEIRAIGTASASQASGKFSMVLVPG